MYSELISPSPSRSGIPGIEGMFASGDSGDGKPKRKAGKLDKRQSKGFHKMNDASKGKFMKAVFGKDGE